VIADARNASSKPPRQAVERDQLRGRDARPHQRPFVRPNKHFRDQGARVL
jgi:hypothetical protein